jgi:hypothetical protein
MYQFSRAIYRELSPFIEPRRVGSDLEDHHSVLQACEAAVTRLASDKHAFARPTQTLFADIRSYFPMREQKRVLWVTGTYMRYARQFLAENPLAYHDVSGEPLQCRATTRKGTPCRRTPLPHNGYCPSHQHLAETEHAETEHAGQLIAA